MTLQSIKVFKAEDLPPETRVKNNLPETGFVEVRIEKHSDPSPRFKKLTTKSAETFRKELLDNGLLNK